MRDGFPPVGRDLCAFAYGSTTIRSPSGRVVSKFSPHIRIVGRSIRSLPGIPVHTTVNPPQGRYKGSVLLLVQEGNTEDRLWAQDVGNALMRAGRAVWVVEIRDSDILPTDSPRVLRAALHDHALFWPEWLLAYGPSFPSQRELAEIFVEYCQKRGRWGDPAVIDALHGCDDIYTICTGSPLGSFRSMFFKVREEKMKEKGEETMQEGDDV